MPVPIVQRPGLPATAGDHERRIRALERQRKPTGPASGFIRYDFENVGDWLDVTATGKNPDTSWPVHFDVATDGSNNVDGVGFQDLGLVGGFVIEARKPGETVSLGGITVLMEGDSASTITGMSTGIAAGGTIIGHQDSILTPGSSYQAGTQGRYEDTGGGSSVYGADLAATGVSSSDVAAYYGNATASSALGDGATSASGAELFAHATGGDATAYGVQAYVYLADSATGYSGYFVGGGFFAKLDSGATFEIQDASFQPIFRITENGTFHIKTGATWVADL